MALEAGTDFLSSLGATGLGDFSVPNLVTPPSDPIPGVGGSAVADLGSAFGGLSDAPLSFASGGFDTSSTAGLGSDISQGAGAAIGSPSGGGIGSDWAASGGIGGGTDALLSGDPNNPTNLKPPADLTGGAPAGATPQTGGSSMSPLAKTALMAAPALGVAGFQALRGPQIPSQVGALTDLGNAQAGQSAQLMQQYNAGNIQPGAALQIQNNLRNQISKINQYYAGNGKQGNLDRFNSTDRLKAIQQAQNAATAQYQQFLDSELKGALAASGQAGQFIAQAAQLTLSADAAFSKALSDAMAGIGKVAGIGLSGGQTTTTTTTTQAA